MTEEEKELRRTIGDAIACNKIAEWLHAMGGLWGAFGGETGVTPTCMCGSTKTHVAIVLPDGAWACGSTIMVAAETLGFDPWPTEDTDG